MFLRELCHAQEEFAQARKHTMLLPTGKTISQHWESLLGGPQRYCPREPTFPGSRGGGTEEAEMQTLHISVYFSEREVGGVGESGGGSSQGWWVPGGLL